MSETTTCALSKESAHAAVCRGYRSVDFARFPDRSLSARCLRRCRSPAPACCCQPGAQCRGTACSTRPEGQAPDLPLLLPTEADFHRVMAWTGGGWSAPPPRWCRQRPSHPHRVAPVPLRRSPNTPAGCPTARFEGLCRPKSKLSAAVAPECGWLSRAPRRTGIRSGPSVCSGCPDADAFTASVPFDGHTPEGALLSHSALPSTLLNRPLTRPRPARFVSGADRLQGFSPPTSP
jgi:hypothetical protein